MNMLYVFLMVCLTFVNTSFGQKNEISTLEHAYLGLKNALISEDNTLASKQAIVIINSVETISKLNLTSSQQKVWLKNKDVIVSKSKLISKSEDIEKQRNQLNELSIAVYEILKEFNISDSILYYQYCPMKKSYWLSEIKDIKNPYYGKKMLTCGSNKDILK